MTTFFVNLMEKLLEFILSKIVDHKDQLKITSEKKNEMVYLHIRVALEDMPKIIGRRGRVINSIRQVLKVASYLKGQKTFLVLDE